jgi:hypothetical protein
VTFRFIAGTERDVSMKIIGLLLNGMGSKYSLKEEAGKAEEEVERQHQGLVHR